MLRNNEPIHCPACRSKQVFYAHARVPDEYFPLNAEDFYTEEEYYSDGYEIPEIFIKHCIKCGYMWAF